MQNATNVTQFEYFGGNFEFSSSINKGATIKPLHNLEKKNPALVLAKNNSGLDHVWKNILVSSIEKKCLPSIHEKKMSSPYT